MSAEFKIFRHRQIHDFFVGDETRSLSRPAQDHERGLGGKHLRAEVEGAGAADLRVERQSRDAREGKGGLKEAVGRSSCRLEE